MKRAYIAIASLAALLCAIPAQAQMTDELKRAAATCRQHVHRLEERLARTPVTPGMFDKGWEHCVGINAKFNAEFLAEQQRALTAKELEDQAATKAFADKLK